MHKDYLFKFNISKLICHTFGTISLSIVYIKSKISYFSINYYLC